MLLVGTDESLAVVERDAPVRHTPVAHPPRLLGGRWAVHDDHAITCLDSGVDATAPATITAIAQLRSGDALIGMVGAAVGVVSATVGGWRDVPAFATVDRSDWYDPRGDSPDVFSVGSTSSGAWLVAVHVGGLWRSDDEGASWSQVVPTDADVHHVVADDERVAVAAAAGVATSSDGGRTFAPFRTRGLDHQYCTAVAIAGDAVVIGSSAGPFGETVLYRGRFDDDGFERTGTEIATVAPIDARHVLVAVGSDVAFGAGRTLWRSGDCGTTWAKAAEERSDIRCVGPSG